MAITHPPSHGHKRKISRADLDITFRNAAPMVPPPQQSHSQSMPPNPSQLQAARMEDLRRQDTARRASRKPTDRDLPFEELSGVVIGDGVERYRKLREVERKLDATMMRKRLDVQEGLMRRYARREGVLRVWVSNTCEGQHWQIAEEERAGGAGGDDGGMGLDFGENSRATFRVKIEGRLLESTSEDEDVDDEGGVSEKHKEDGEKAKEKDRVQKTQPKFSNFFRAITVDFSSRNASLNPDGYSAIEWRKPLPPSTQHPNSHYDPNDPSISFDTLEFERKGDDNVNVTINLVREEKNERFRLSPLLAELLDTEEEDRAGAVQGCGSILFNQDKIYFPYIPDLLIPHLLPLPPTQLHYSIRVDKLYIQPQDSTTPPSAPTIYDIRVPLPENPTQKALTKFHTSKTHLATLRSIVQADDDLAVLVQKIQSTNGKRKFYDSLSRDPANFVKRWVGSQGRDLGVIAAEGGGRGGGGSGDDGGLGEEWRRGGPEGVWGGVGAREGVGLWLARNGKAGH
ncbi:SWI/SNF and RSC complex subunit Ssr3 [Friedmanniomyces endolithicus]|nr:SWI/SNF and RSC complex subunit Ssr3 [Friedmanniomyces endolithicus]